MQQSKLMTRRTWLVLPATLTACRKSTLPQRNVFPETVAGVWHRQSLTTTPSSPDPVPMSAVVGMQEAGYSGPGKLDARVYELDSQAAGADLAQRWRPSADTVFFNRDQFFVIIKWQEADRNALKDFVRELEQKLGPPQQHKS
ncbi:MAG TPA: hypothetical protein VG675_00845 [Bryobacteraceae bacterium]|nr:hypothetical protein [Bryobacteraceae bacterium]